ncbi:YitT family protein [Erysipelothrix sp. HDW6B]|uniref:YitT family protein n=1 Tax=Erysipelothrix sp. HDW6B TaxID=2714929 RepID=UPI00140A27AB|nr:YitT family protein [Erysipelothrix sp. HDW6B]QIK87037.1 YitT family protein [Erysipelothrix sp. HDW6B]
MKQYQDKITNALLLVLGNFVLACGVTFFILPNNILSGGVAGVAVALYPILRVEPRIMMNIIIGLAFLMGLVFLGKKFALKTLASSILYPLFVNLLSLIPFNATLDPLIASLFGGIFMGIGLGLTFKTGASTGGMDIPPLILSRYTGIRVSVYIFAVDAATVLLGFHSYTLNQVLMGFISIYASTKAIDKISLIGGIDARQVTIISDEYESILDYLHNNIDRGSTIITARGGYTQDRKEIVMTVISKKQYNDLEKAVLSIDSEAFLVVSNATEVHGKGFRTV